MLSVFIISLIVGVATLPLINKVKFLEKLILKSKSSSFYLLCYALMALIMIFAMLFDLLGSAIIGWLFLVILWFMLVRFYKEEIKDKSK